MWQEIAKTRYWETTALADMDAREWEALCDGCGRCCLLKLENEDAKPEAEDRFVYTSVACKLLDCSSGQCSSYQNRHDYVPDCVVLRPETLDSQLQWMPNTCAYRLLAEGKPLQDWHPLISGHADSVVAAGISVGGWASSETDIEDEEELLDHIAPPFHALKPVA